MLPAAAYVSSDIKGETIAQFLAEFKALVEEEARQIVADSGKSFYNPQLPLFSSSLLRFFRTNLSEAGAF